MNLSIPPRVGGWVMATRFVTVTTGILYTFIFTNNWKYQETVRRGCCYRKFPSICAVWTCTMWNSAKYEYCDIPIIVTRELIFFQTLSFTHTSYNSHFSWLISELKLSNHSSFWWSYQIWIGEHFMWKLINCSIFTVQVTETSQRVMNPIVDTQ